MAKTKKATDIVTEFLRDALSAQLDDQSGKETYPSLHSCLLPIFEEGKLVRPGARLTITVEGPIYRLKLDCPYEVIQCSLAVVSLIDALAVLETALASGMVNWTPGYKATKNRKTLLDKPIQ